MKKPHQQCSPTPSHHTIKRKTTRVVDEIRGRQSEREKEREKTKKKEPY